MDVAAAVLGWVGENRCLPAVLCFLLLPLSFFLAIGGGRAGGVMAMCFSLSLSLSVMGMFRP